MGRALPGHLVDEGKLVLFLDEEIAPRAPKRGKRRKAETQRRRAQGQGRPKKRKTEPETGTETGSPLATTAADADTDAGAADVIVVGGGPATKEEAESESDVGNLDPDPTAGTSVPKLKYSTVRLYSSAIINLVKAIILLGVYYIDKPRFLELYLMAWKKTYSNKKHWKWLQSYRTCTFRSRRL
ncbi:hypothetical protein N658DRAFT_254330 [Parathielavia hyrcaniae]|uniref:Uncharacterized protein n=1 Tax=Parathielavia hyrcaniae TaxID=113614 RepID=A0AAN6SYS4_9PEZI|nr:hypothetical protein N658DRAFT_254330 [Parathielavia hyrcaniae]